MLEARRWDPHANRSIISPTALAFLIPVLVVFFLMPLICVFCVRKRRRDQPTRRRCPVKLPALQRSEARERLASVAEVSGVTGSNKVLCVDQIEEKIHPDNLSILGKECAICLSTLYAPSPPEPAKLSHENGAVEEAVTAHPKSICEQEEILRLKECGHEFHTECLISWVVLHKKSCPICRTVYYHEEPEKLMDMEAQVQSAIGQESRASELAVRIPPPVSSNEPPASNWHYFWNGQGARQNHTHPNVWLNRQRFSRFRS